MRTWLTALETMLQAGTPAVLVTVAAVAGSGPREPGAKMLVTADTQADTIGGGHLELRACEVAREMLTPASDARRLVRFPLGPGLGQCCGGVVHLAFERIDAHNAAYYALLARRLREREDSWRIVPFANELQPALYDAQGRCLIGPSAPPAWLEHDAVGHLVKDGAGRAWLVDPCRNARPQLLLFGAGHVGAALIQALAPLPCDVTWVDEREELFPNTLPANVTIEATDTPEAVVAAAPAGASYLVMTHSHALDLRLCEAILQRADAGWFGLIGSQTKRMQFEHRLQERGIAAARLRDMVCPIGIPGIAGKAPAVIAAAVCAQLLQVWEAAAAQDARTAHEACTQRSA